MHRPDTTAPSSSPLRWPTVSVVIPTLNEAANLPYVLPRIPGWVDEVVLVDGGSTDPTVRVARVLRPDVVVLRQQGRGKGDALIQGIRGASGEVVVTLDADGSADPEEIPAFVGALLSGADLARGTRFVQGGGTTDMEWYRNGGNRGLRMVAGLLFNTRFSDLCYGYNAFWRERILQLDLDCDGFEFETLLTLRAVRAELAVTEVASFEAPRLHGRSNLRTFRDGVRVLRTIVREWRATSPVATDPLEPPTRVITLPESATVTAP